MLAVEPRADDDDITFQSAVQVLFDLCLLAFRDGFARGFLNLVAAFSFLLGFPLVLGRRGHALSILDDHKLAIGWVRCVLHIFQSLHRRNRFCQSVLFL